MSTKFSFFDACDEKDVPSIATEISTAIHNGGPLSQDKCSKLHSLACDSKNNDFLIKVAEQITAPIYEYDDFYQSVKQGCDQGDNEALLLELGPHLAETDTHEFDASTYDSLDDFDPHSWSHDLYPETI